MKTGAVKTGAVKTGAVKTEAVKTEAVKTEAVKTGSKMRKGMNTRNGSCSARLCRARLYRPRLYRARFHRPRPHRSRRVFYNRHIPHSIPPPKEEGRMNYRHILCERDAGVATITMNRPDVLNSCNGQMVAELRDAFVDAGSTDAVRAVVLTGAGRAFCAGQDLGEAAPARGAPLPDLGAIVASTTRSCAPSVTWRSPSSRQ